MTSPSVAASSSNTAPRYFPVSLLKLSVLSVVSLGAYDLYWFYKHWKLERDTTGVALSPFLRAVFGPIFAYSLFKRIRSAGEHITTAPTVSAGAMAIAYFVWAGSWRLPDPYWLICAFSFVPLLPVQRAANAINAQLAPDADRNAHFSGANVALIVVGTLFLGLIVLGMLVPADAGTGSPSTNQMPVAT